DSNCTALFLEFEPAVPGLAFCYGTAIRPSDDIDVCNCCCALV
ncbi:MAG: hypothetical protein ACI9CO_002475, partial [Candidatus Azotimanducaceae bacterium]